MKYKFNNFVLDPASRELHKDGIQVSLPPKAFSVLIFLIEQRERMISKRELFDKFWAANASDCALLKSISIIRNALHTQENSENPIKTYHGQGYRFIAKVENNEISIAPGNRRQVKEIRLASIISVKIHSHLQEEENYLHDTQQLYEQLFGFSKSLSDQLEGKLLHALTDGLTIAFGVDRTIEDVARRAVRCSNSLIQYGNKNFKKPFISAGIDTGNVRIPDKENDCQPINYIERTANQLANDAALGETLVSDSTRKLLSDEIETEEAINGHKLISSPQPRSGIPGRPQKSPSKFIGRTPEQAFIFSNLNTAFLGQGKAISLVGPAGIGKTRLTSELLTQWHPKHCYSILVHCLPGLVNTPLSPIRDLCKLLVSYLGERPLFRDDLDLALLDELIAEPKSENPLIKGLSEHEHRKKSQNLATQLISKLCAERPLIIVLEDAHWIDATSRAYFLEIINSIQGKPVFILITTRPSEFPLLTDAVLNIPPLSRKECLELLNSHKYRSDIKAKAIDLLIQRSEGNPFFLEELALAQQKKLGSVDTPPQTIQSVLSFRIASLPINLRTLVYIISVVRPPANIKLVSHLANNSIDELENDVNTLVKKDFLIFEAGILNFRHILINDVAYTMIANDDRTRLHLLIAAYYENFSDNSTRPEILAWHYQEAGDTDRSISFWIAACRSALSRSAHYEATAFAKNGIALINQDSQRYKEYNLDLQLMLASALTTLDGFADSTAGSTYFKARKINREVHSTKAQIRILVGLWIHSLVRGELSNSMSFAKELMTLSKQIDRPSLCLQAHASIGQVLMHFGEIPSARDHLLKGLESIVDEPPKTLPEQNSATSCAAYASWCCSLLGETNDSEFFYKLSKKYSTLQTNPFARAIHYALRSGSLMVDGDSKNCLKVSSCAVKVSREHNFSFWLGTGLVQQAWALCKTGHQDKALASLQEGITFFEGTGARVQLANWYGLKAEILLSTGGYKAAIDTANEALDYAEKTQDQFFTPRIHAVASVAFKCMNNKKNARFHSAKAEKLIEKFGMHSKVINLSHSPVR